MMYALVEKKNHLAIHALFDTKERAEYHLQNVIPDYVARKLFVDKSLRVCDFEITEYKEK